MEQPLVSVIMGVFNQRDRKILQESVNSILNQTYGNFEFIIWDDGSEPDAAQLVMNLKQLDPRIFVAGKEENRGLAYSLNECIRLAKGKYIARMDADDISKPDRLEKQVDFLERRSEYGWCGTGAELFDESGIWGSRMMPEIPRMRDYFRYSPYVHPSVMFRAELFDENHRYLSTEETLRCEDYEIFMNLVGRGQQGYNLQEKLFCYRETRESYKKRKVRFRINEARTRYRNYRKMGILFPAGWIYVLRPVAAMLVPSGVLAFLKRSEGIHAKEMEEKKHRNTAGKMEAGYLEIAGIPDAAGTLPGQFAEEAGTFSGARHMPEGIWYR